MHSAAPCPLVLVALMTTWSPSAAATDYFVRPDGNDAQDGTSHAKAWATVQQVTNHAWSPGLQPGDRVLFLGGATFTGKLYLEAPRSVSSAEAPVTITSYALNNGNVVVPAPSTATLSNASDDALFVYNLAGMELRHLRFQGLPGNNHHGINFYVDLAGNQKISHVVLDHVECMGWGKDGFVIGSWNGTSGYRDVRVTNSSFHDNGTAGMGTYSKELHGLENVYVADSRFFGNTGIAGNTNPTGNGVVLGGVDGATIERCVAHHNGRLNTNTAGPVGIWTYNSRRVTIQFNESYANETNGGDGGGFDIDGAVTDSVIQYNYSHDNAGPGYLYAQYEGSPGPFARNTIRYNISQNDGRRNNNDASIVVWGNGGGTGTAEWVTDSDIYNNVVYLDASAGTNRSGIKLIGKYTGVRVRNNVFVVDQGMTLAKATGASTHVLFQSNAYWVMNGSFKVTFDGSTSTSLTQWRSTGQEMDGTRPLGLWGEPGLVGVGTGSTLDDANLIPQSLPMYQLKNDSPLVNAGWPQTAPGTRDFFGNALFTGEPDIGVHEVPSSPPVDGGGMDSGSTDASSSARDASTPGDAGVTPDASTTPDAGTVRDAGTARDAASVHDAAPPADSGTWDSSQPLRDAAAPPDSAHATDAASSTVDGSLRSDAAGTSSTDAAAIPLDSGALPADAGEVAGADSGTDDGAESAGSCACTHAGPHGLGVLLAALLAGWFMPPRRTWTVRRSIDCVT